MSAGATRRVQGRIADDPKVSRNRPRPGAARTGATSGSDKCFLSLSYGRGCNLDPVVLPWFHAALQGYIGRQMSRPTWAVNFQIRTRKSATGWRSRPAGRGNS